MQDKLKWNAIRLIKKTSGVFRIWTEGIVTNSSSHSINFSTFHKLGIFEQLLLQSLLLPQIVNKELIKLTFELKGKQN